MNYGTMQLVLSAALVLQLGTTATADILDFEDLPVPPNGEQPGLILALMPTNFHGFRFTASNDVYPDTYFDNTWVYWQLEAELQNPPCTIVSDGNRYGYTSGITAIGSYQDGGSGEWSNHWTMSRADGGLWSFDGAWFTATLNAPEIIIRGFLGNTQVFNFTETIEKCTPTFHAPQSQVLIDRLVIRGGPLIHGGDKAFLMDDFQFTLVPAPSAGFLLLAAALTRRRREG